MKNMEGLFDENKKFEDGNSPWLTCQALQCVFKDDGTPFIFSTRDEKYEGVFKKFSKNEMKVLVKKDGDATLFWKSKKLKDKKLCHILEKNIEENTIGLQGDFDIWMNEDEEGFYSLEVQKSLIHGEDSFEFAREIACEVVFFLADVNLLVKVISSYESYCFLVDANLLETMIQD